MLIVLIIIAILLFLILIAIEPEVLELMGSCLVVIFGLSVLLVVGGVLLYVLLPEMNGSDTSPQAVAIAPTSYDEAPETDLSHLSDEELMALDDGTGEAPDVSQMTDEELLREIASECGKPASAQMPVQELREIAAGCAASDDAVSAANAAADAAADAADAAVESAAEQ